MSHVVGTGSPLNFKRGREMEYERPTLVNHSRVRWPQRSSSPGYLMPWRKVSRIVGMGRPASRYLHGAGAYWGGLAAGHTACFTEAARPEVGINHWVMPRPSNGLCCPSVRPSVAVQQHRSTIEGHEDFTLCDNIPHRTRVTNSTSFGQKGQRSRSPGHIMLAQVKQWWHLANTFTLTWPAQMLLINCLSRQTIHWAKNVTVACPDLCTRQWFSFLHF